MTKQTTNYTVTTNEGTETFGNLGAVGKYLGKKVTKKGVEAGKYPEITFETVEVEELTMEEISGGAVVELEPVEEPTEEVVTTEVAVDAATQSALDAISKAMDTVDDSTHPDLFNQLCDLEDAINDGNTLTDEQAALMTQVLTNTYMDTQEDTVLTNTQEEEDSYPDDASDIEYPEIGYFADEKAMKKYIKPLKDSELAEWCELEGATWKPNDHESINRMRMAMAIKAKHFPDTAPKATKKSKSKYAQYETEQLVQMALDNDVEIPDDKGDNRILRMYTIMALRKAGIIE